MVATSRRVSLGGGLWTGMRSISPGPMRGQFLVVRASLMRWSEAACFLMGLTTWCGLPRRRRSTWGILPDLPSKRGLTPLTFHSSGQWSNGPTALIFGLTFQSDFPPEGRDQFLRTFLMFLATPI